MQLTAEINFKCINSEEASAWNYECVGRHHSFSPLFIFFTNSGYTQCMRTYANESHAKNAGKLCNTKLPLY